MKADGTEETLITQGSRANAVPTWSPSGIALAFESKRDGKADTYCIDSDGTNSKRITTDPGSDFSRTWLPDGPGLVFQSNRTGHYQIYGVAFANSSLTQITHVDGNAYSPWLSPQGNFIACIVMGSEETSAIHVMEHDGRGLRPVSGWVEGTLHGVAGSPDGKTLAFMSDRDGAVDILTMPATGGEMVNLTSRDRR